MNRIARTLQSLRAWLAAHGIKPWRWAVALALLGLACGTGMLLWTMNCGTGCPAPEEIRSFRPTEGSRILDRNGRFIGRVSYVRRINVPLDSVPEHVRNAFLAVEDRRFYQHEGIDWRGMARATLRNIRALGVREGFSTITMQVARNAFIPHLMSERSINRKLREIGTTWRIEDVLTKDEILELYLNIIYFGNGTYGVEAASRDLFGKSVGELNITQAATLAGLPKAPSSYAPRLHPDRALARRNLVLELMVEEGYITPAQRDTARARSLGLSRRGWTLARDTSFALDPVREMVDSVLGDSVPRGDVIVHTTLDHVAQRAAEQAVRAQAAVIQRMADVYDRRRGDDEIEGALVALDPTNGEIRALVGSRHFTRRGFNRALRARRQPGSAFKPFVYAAALMDGWTPASTVEDLPIEITDSLGKVWRPANDRGFAGTVTLRRALMRSSNAATVRLSRQVGEARVIAT
ncbi:MAG: transglycosylase domain-containing protein, partial [Gemmatimonadota bacterium]|nr:transglycosylase domain-containing protein [Gemmatimonadota bacterium]